MSHSLTCLGLDLEVISHNSGLDSNFTLPLLKGKVQEWSTFKEWKLDKCAGVSWSIYNLISGLQDYQAALKIDPNNEALCVDIQRIKDIIQGSAVNHGTETEWQRCRACALYIMFMESLPLERQHPFEGLFWIETLCDFRFLKKAVRYILEQLFSATFPVPTCVLLNNDISLLLFVS